MSDTLYKKAWDKWTASPEAIALMRSMLSPENPRQPYVENRIRMAFDAGWDACMDKPQEPEHE
jgi:hypothetical protein